MFSTKQTRWNNSIAVSKNISSFSSEELSCVALWINSQNRHTKMNQENSSKQLHSDEKKMFVTTSDLMSIVNETSQGNFELQRRMPDGSTKRADEADIAAADFQAKINQVSLSYCNENMSLWK